MASRQKDLDFCVKKARADELKKINSALHKKFISQNKSGRVLIEEVINGKSYGFTENYIKCEIDAVCNVGDIVNVNITGGNEKLAFANLA